MVIESVGLGAGLPEGLTMFSLILFAFLSSSGDGQVRTVREVVETGLTWDECNKKKAKAIAAAKREELKQVGGACVRRDMWNG